VLTEPVSRSKRPPTQPGVSLHSSSSRDDAIRNILISTDAERTFRPAIVEADG